MLNIIAAWLEVEALKSRQCYGLSQFSKKLLLLPGSPIRPGNIIDGGCKAARQLGF
jgi:hypothetical protein